MEQNSKQHVQCDATLEPGLLEGYFPLSGRASTCMNPSQSPTTMHFSTTAWHISGLPTCVKTARVRIPESVTAKHGDPRSEGRPHLHRAHQRSARSVPRRHKSGGIPLPAHTVDEGSQDRHRAGEARLAPHPPAFHLPDASAGVDIPGEHLQRMSAVRMMTMMMSAAWNTLALWFYREVRCICASFDFPSLCRTQYSVLMRATQHVGIASNHHPQGHHTLSLIR